MHAHGHLCQRTCPKELKAFDDKCQTKGIKYSLFHYECLYMCMHMHTNVKSLKLSMTRSNKGHQV